MTVYDTILKGMGLETHFTKLRANSEALTAAQTVPQESATRDVQFDGGDELHCSPRQRVQTHHGPGCDPVEFRLIKQQLDSSESHEKQALTRRSYADSKSVIFLDEDENPTPPNCKKRPFSDISLDDDAEDDITMAVSETQLAISLNRNIINLDDDESSVVDAYDENKMVIGTKEIQAETRSEIIGNDEKGGSRHLQLPDQNIVLQEKSSDADSGPPGTSTSTKEAVTETLKEKKERMCSMKYTTIYTALREKHKTIRGMVEKLIPRSDEARPVKMLLEECQELEQAMEWKWQKVIERHKPRQRQGEWPKTTEELRIRLGEEEKFFPWIPSEETNTKLPNNGLLMRVTDESSQAKIYPDVGFLSGGSNERLNTAKARKTALEKHLNFRNRTPTVFVSVSGDAHDFFQERVVRMQKRDARKPNANTIRLTFINGHARIAARWPILQVDEQVKHYGVRAGIVEWVYKHELVLPYRVDTAQIVATYCWTAVEQFMKENKCDSFQWYKTVAEPAFLEHEAARKEGRPVRGEQGCVCCGH